MFGNRKTEIKTTKPQTTMETMTENKTNFVDLGLPSGTLWADRNLGAEKPEDYGELRTFDEAKADAATSAQWTELTEKCEWRWQGGGYEVVGKNGNSIFLPSAGYRYGATLDHQGTYGYYWSSSLNTGFAQFAFNAYFSASHVWPAYSNNRFYGFSVRPVCKPGEGKEERSGQETAAEREHKFAVCYTTRRDGTQVTDTYTLANRNHRKEFVYLMTSAAMGENPDVKRLTVDFTD